MCRCSTTRAPRPLHRTSLTLAATLGRPLARPLLFLGSPARTQSALARASTILSVPEIPETEPPRPALPHPVRSASPLQISIRLPQSELASIPVLLHAPCCFQPERVALHREAAG